MFGWENIVGSQIVDTQCITWNDVRYLAKCMVDRVQVIDRRVIRVYPVPRGGVYAAMAMVDSIDVQIKLVETPDLADIIVDDVIDSGATEKRFKDRYPDKPFHALINKMKIPKQWISFPWERMNNEVGPEDNIRRIIEYIGDDPNREGLLETPSRVVRSYAELFSGYKYKTDEDVANVIKVFSDGATDELVILKGIEFVSYCEHHILPFTGVAHVAYLPDQNIIGLSKLARIVDIYARRLQVQERLTQQVTNALDLHLKPKGSACVIEGKHTCMCYRGVGKQNATMITSSITGDFRKPEVRAEFFSLIKG